MTEDTPFLELFAPESGAAQHELQSERWKILLVDDEPDIHVVLRMALDGVVVEGRSLELLDAYSAAEARQCLAENREIALVLLDVVMESNSAGLDLVQYIRNDLSNNNIQILLVTGQPGYAPEREVVTKYAIDGYRLKSELTADKIFAFVYSALRTFLALNELDKHHRRLTELVAERTRELELRNAQLSDTQFAMDRVGIGLAWNDAATGRFLYVNDEACRQLGYSREELYGLTVSDVNQDFPPEAVHRLARELRQSEGGRCFETRHRRKDGTEYAAEVTTYIHHAPERDWFIVFLSDITSRKQQEERLIQARDEAEAASRAKSAFLSNMSHELRTPMNAIMGMTGLAIRHADDPKLKHQLLVIEEASQHLLSVINDILDISKIEAEKLVLEHLDFELGDVLHSLISLIGQKVAEKGLNLKVDVPAGLLVLGLKGDRMRLSQIFLNLASNAVKFTDTGEIVLHMDLAEEHATDVLLRCEVRDSGIGIPLDAQSRLFSAFEQADGTMTRKYGGTGLGLAISRRLVEMMGGEIGVQSEPGRGSTFWFTVRLERVPKDPPEALNIGQTEIKAQLRRHYAGCQVLLVEDEPISQEITQYLLEDVGLNVDVAGNGVEAAEKACRIPYALILMDMQMPNMNGLDATRTIRRAPVNALTPIIAMTANAFSDDRQKCLEAGMNDHIAKPLEPDVLYATILRWGCRPSPVVKALHPVAS